MDKLVFENLEGMTCSIVYSPVTKRWVGFRTSAPYSRTAECKDFVSAYLQSRHSRFEKPERLPGLVEVPRLPEVFAQPAIA